MINKQNIFASAGQQAQGYSASDYVAGMVPNTIAMAEDVNSFGNTLDKELDSVCKEVANVITSGVLDKDGGDGATLNPASYTQLLTALRAMSNGFTQTGIMYDGSSITCPVQNGTTSISFGGQIKIMYNEGGYFGNSASKMHIGTINAGRTWTITNSEATGVRFLIATLSGGSVVLSTADAVPEGSAGATKCYLGSFFVVDNNGTKQIQANSWKFQPWLQNTPAINRESPTAQTKGGLLTPNTGTTLNIGALEVKAEGINFATEQNKPNIMSLQAGSFSYKFLYPGYNPADTALTALDTTHLYNLTGASWDDISSKEGFIVMVPCVVPTGQTLMIPAMSSYDQSTGNYSAVFPSVDDATNAVYGLHYTSTDTDKTRERAIYLGYSIIVKIGATDLTNPNNYAIVGMVPQELDGFTNAGGQTGGGVGQYVPMPEINKGGAGTTALTVTVNEKTVITGNANNINVSLSGIKSGIVNQLEIAYTHTAGNGGITLISADPNYTVEWWGSAPTFTDGKTYLIICEVVGNKWMCGYLEK